MDFGLFVTLHKCNDFTICIFFDFAKLYILYIARLNCTFISLTWAKVLILYKKDKFEISDINYFYSSKFVIILNPSQGSK